MYQKVGEFDDVIRFDDISVRFDSATVRVRVFINGDSEDILVGRTLLPLVNYLATQPRGAAAIDMARLQVEPTSRTRRRSYGRGLSSLSPGKKKIDVAATFDAGHGSIAEPTEELVQSWCPLEFGPNGLQAPPEAVTSTAANRWAALRRETRAISEVYAGKQTEERERADSGSQRGQPGGGHAGKKASLFSIAAHLHKASSHAATKSAGGQVHVAMLAHKPERKAKKAHVKVKKEKHSSGGGVQTHFFPGPGAGAEDATASGGMLGKIIALRNKETSEPKGEPPAPAATKGTLWNDFEFEAKQPDATL